MGTPNAPLRLTDYRELAAGHVTRPGPLRLRSSWLHRRADLEQLVEADIDRSAVRP